MTTGRVALMSVLFGPFYGVLLGAVMLLGRGNISLAGLLTVVVLFCPAFFAVYRLTFAVAWNIRAEKLRTRA